MKKHRIFFFNIVNMDTFSNSYYLEVLAIFGLMIWLYLFSLKNERDMYNILFLLGVLATGVMLSQINFDTFYVTHIYPFGIPFAYTIGPSYLFYNNRYRFETHKVWVHYLPALFLVGLCSTHMILNPTNFENSRSLFLTFHSLDATSTYIITDALLILLFPIHGALYFIGNLWLNKRTEDEFNLDNNLSGIAMLFASPFVFALAHVYVYLENSWFFPFKGILIFILIGTIPAIVFDLILQYRQLKEVKTITYGLEDLDISNYLKRQIFLESDFTKPGFNRRDLYESSGISEDDWENYMLSKKLNFTSLKKWVRVQIAKKLIHDGFLEKYNVDALSEAIGYRSRSSFYSAFREIEAESVSEFRSRH